MSMNKLPAFTIAAQYAAAIAAQQEARMRLLRAGSYQLDAVYLDAYGVVPLAEPGGTDMYRSLFSACPDGKLVVTRTIAGAEVVVQEWTFSGTQTGRTERWTFCGHMPEKPTGREVRLRGVSIYVIIGGLIQCETIYIDHATLLVELGGFP
jgi:predicted ester cyclase